MKRLFLPALIASALSCGTLSQAPPDTRAQVGDAATGAGASLTAAGTATANPILVIVGGLLVAAGFAIKGTGTTPPKEGAKSA